MRSRLFPGARARSLSLAPALLAAALAAGCGGGGGEAASPATTSGTGPAVPGCARAPAVPRPAGLPEDFPLPAGTILTGTRTPLPGALLVDAVVPVPIGEAKRFFTEELPPKGYQLGRGDSEGDEAEAPFTGNGLRGRWRVNSVFGCPEAATLFLSLVKT